MKVLTASGIKARKTISQPDTRSIMGTFKVNSGKTPLNKLGKKNKKYSICIGCVVSCTYDDFNQHWTT